MSADYHNSPTEQRSLTELVRELRDESITLVRQEVALAKTEMGEKATRLSRNAFMLILGGAVAHLGIIFLLLAIVAGLERLFAEADMALQGEWLSPLIVGAVVGVVGVTLAMTAKQKLTNMSIVPKKTVQTLQDDKQWIKEKI